jgi:DNA repair protein SbcD/Mre11
MRFLHAADLHLDTAFVARSEDVRRRLRDASRDALSRLVDLALRERVDAVVLAGDLFDDARISFRTERLLIDQLGRLEEAGLPVVYATGNHDPGRTGARTQSLPWPSNVTLARSTEPVRLEITHPQRGVIGSITAVGHEHEQVGDDLVVSFPPPTGPGCHVAVLHGTVLDSAGAAAHARYAPTTLEALTRTGYDYWALGHIHVRDALSVSPGVHYPGNTQGRTQRERGAKGCLVVDLVERSAPEVAFHRLGPVQWEDLAVRELEHIETLEALVRAVREVWSERTAEHASDPPEDWIVRVILTGPTPLWRELAEEENLAALIDELGYTLGALEVSIDASRVHPPYRVEEHLERRDVLGEALRLLRSVREGSELSVELAELRLIGLEREEERAGYLAGLLADAEPELLARMLKSGPESS